MSNEPKYYIVTVRLKRDEPHDSRIKKHGDCPLSKYNLVCTDRTGEHHSFLVWSNTGIMGVTYNFRRYNITRVEEVRGIVKIMEEKQNEN